MFGVLVVASTEGRIGVLHAFSGQLGGQWEVPGFVPPLFDAQARAEVEPAADAKVKSLTAQMEQLAHGAELAAAREVASTAEAAIASARERLKQTHQARREARHRRRAELAAEDRLGRRRLDAESRQDKLEHRGREDAWRSELEIAKRSLQQLSRRLAAMERLRRWTSQRAMRRIHETYRLTNATGAETTLRSLFAPGEPSWGAGDCAAPKLLAFALRETLRPIALAEFWWGPPPLGGGRVEGAFYPACRLKCGPLLPFLLEGLEVAPRRTVRPRARLEDELVTLHEDERVVVVNKPAGMLSVPARDPEVTDSVLARLRARYPRALGPLLVHRLDLDTSGILLAALDEEAHRLLQAQFIRHTVEKRYVAWVEGQLQGERGTVCLPLGPDLDQRPLQQVAPVNGRPSVTDWEVLERCEARTKVSFWPRTGRTHQLRVHAAHRRGLNAPIVGDRLYGQPAERLLLHAESLTFRHPNGETLTVRQPAPF
jgi:tRNA pseudouridine32 synthase/23S rRNA pseudouridine746 synthase